MSFSFTIEDILYANKKKEESSSKLRYDYEDIITLLGKRLWLR